MPPTRIWVMVAAALVIAVIATVAWIRVLRRVEREETDPAERRKWYNRVLLLRGFGVIWYENHRRKLDSDRGPTAD